MRRVGRVGADDVRHSDEHVLFLEHADDVCSDIVTKNHLVVDIDAEFLTKNHNNNKRQK